MDGFNEAGGLGEAQPPHVQTESSAQPSPQLNMVMKRFCFKDESPKQASGGRGSQPHGDDMTCFRASMDDLKKAGGVVGEAKTQEKPESPEAKKSRSEQAEKPRSRNT